MLLKLFYTILFFELVFCFPEQGKWTLEVNQDSQYVGMTKSMYNNTKIIVKVKCSSPSFEPISVEIAWILRKTPCWKEYIVYHADENEEEMKFHKSLFEQPEVPLVHSTSEVYYYPYVLLPDHQIEMCSDNIILPEVDGRKMIKVQPPTKSRSDSNGVNSSSGAAMTDDEQTELDLASNREVMGGVRVRRQVLSTNGTVGSTEVSSTNPLWSDSSFYSRTDGPMLTAGSGARTKHPIVKVNSDGVYLFMMRVSSITPNSSFTATLDIEMVSDYGYLSASDYPLLVFYSVMCVVYAIYAAVWLLLCFLRWRDLLRLQYWIAAVIIMGLIEKAAFVAEYESLNEQGYSVRGVLIIAELISCAKRTIARILVLIVALGFGIVKPRLGTLLHRVIGLGMLYFVLASIESCTRALRPKTDPSKQALLALVPLALLDSLICWWVFSALVTTTRTLRLRRNPVKLSVYTHFTNVLAAAVVASIAFMFWSIRFHQYEDCLEDWKQLWVDIAFWHLLFALLLLAIMMLWRPTNNNQRFAFSPLLDEGSDDDGGEEAEQLMGTGLTADTKHRGKLASSNGSSPRSSHTVEDDLKWVEENIPSSLADSGLPVLDSDEEIMTTRFEVSKMQ